MDHLIPDNWLTLGLSLLGIASFIDSVVPPVAPGSRWAIPRALLHFAGQNYDKALRAVGRVP